MKAYSSTFALLLMGAALAGTYSGPAFSEDPNQVETDEKQSKHGFETLDDRFSYAYGADLAEKFKEEGIELNVDILAIAMKDAYRGGEMKMPDDEIAATLDLYQKVHTKKKEAERAIIGKKNKKEGEVFLAENAGKEGVIVTKSGLQYKVITKGNGDYTPTENDEVTVHYRGTFVDGTEFDSTYQRNEPYRVKVKQLIPGWIEALKMMSEGDKWELYIPADIAYGERGSGNYVGPNATLIFEVELLDIEKS